MVAHSTPVHLRRNHLSPSIEAERKTGYTQGIFTPEGLQRATADTPLWLPIAIAGLAGIHGRRPFANACEKRRIASPPVSQ